MHTVLYFGSFNPVHKGHLAIVRYMLEHKLCDKVMIIVSPQNPFKESDMLIAEEYRLKMVELAIAEEKLDGRAEACGIEFELPKPSYTANTLRKMAEIYPNNRFSILMGEDNISGLERWRDTEWISANYDIFVYPRKDKPSEVNVWSERVIKLNNVPLFDVSSTMIRKNISSGKGLQQWLHNSVYEYIKDHKLWT